LSLCRFGALESYDNLLIQAKRELAKKEGRLLTKKQKEEKQMAELRRQALLASGVQIEGLHQGAGSGPPAAKKVVYGNRKKKGATATKDGSLVPGSRPRSPEPSSEAPSPAPSAPIQLPVEEKTFNGDAKSDWEASTEEEAKPEVPSSVKDSWDDSSEGEEASE
jgi:translation initiation factor 5B